MAEKRILVVDDEPFILRSLTFILKKNGYEVDSATNGEEAIEAILSGKPRLVFLDLMMPKKNGLEVCSEVRQHQQLNDVHIIMLTAKVRNRTARKGWRPGPMSI